MMREGYKAQAFWSLEQFLGEHAVAYGSTLARTLGPRWRPEAVVATQWIEWYLDAVATQVTFSERKLRRSMAEFSTVLAGIAEDKILAGDAKRFSRAVIAVWLAVTVGTVTRRQLARYLDVSSETLHATYKACVRRTISGAKVKGGRRRIDQDLVSRVGATSTNWSSSLFAVVSRPYGTSWPDEPSRNHCSDGIVRLRPDTFLCHRETGSPRVGGRHES
jgi:hypothetical protein